MTTVMISGSRSISKLPQSALDSLDKIIDSNFKIVIGDSEGVDTLVQEYLKSKNYDNVIIYHVGECQNNLGFSTIKVFAVKYGVADILMSKVAHYGLAIWDGKSEGTLANIQRLPMTTKVIKV